MKHRAHNENAAGANLAETTPEDYQKEIDAMIEAMNEDIQKRKEARI